MAADSDGVKIPAYIPPKIITGVIKENPANAYKEVKVNSL